MPRIIASAALCLVLTAGTVHAQQQQQQTGPVMSPTMITQDTTATSGDILVPLLFVVFALVALHGGSGGGAISIID
jgi:hypothetical protein